MQNNNKTRGNEKLTLVTIFEFVYNITGAGNPIILYVSYHL